MKVLVTGGTGFLGHHIREEFAKFDDIKDVYISRNNHKHIICNMLNMKSFVEVLYKESPDVILHMAANCGGILANRNSPADFLVDNLQMGINLFQSVLSLKDNKRKVPKVYTLGSVCAYPKHCPIPFKEDDLWKGFPESTNSGYGHAKRTLLMLQNSYRDQYGIKGAHLIPVNLYGLHDHFNPTNSHVIPALIKKFVDAVDNKDSTVTLWGTGKATREFLYAGDAAEAIVKAININLNTELPINIGNGRDISIYNLAKRIAYLCGYEGEIEFDELKPDGQPERRLDVSRAEEMLGFKSETTLTTGLVRTITWYSDNKHLVKD